MITRYLRCVLLLVFATSAAMADTVPRVTAAEAAKWREDLRVALREMPRLHKDLFHKIDRGEFERMVSELDRRVPSLSRAEIIVGLAKIVAAVGDGHTGISGLLYGQKVGFRYYPVGTYLFADGLYIYAAAPEYRDALGARITRIGALTVDEAVARVRDLIPRDNDMTVKERAPLYLTTPEVLYSLGIVADMESASFTIEQGGKVRTIVLKPALGQRPADDNWALGQRFSKLPDWVGGRDTGDATPLWLRKPEDYFCFEYLPDSRTLYVQYNDVANKPTESIADFARRVFAFADDHAIDRFVLDLRWNTGGNNYLNKPLLLGIIKSRFDQRGKLFTIIGRRTFSAAQNLVNDLQTYTQTIFVGEPTASNPNFYGDPASIQLPNSGLVIRVSTLWWQDLDPRLKRQWTAPDLAVDLTSKDYFSSVDPAMREVLAYVPERPVTEAMAERLKADDISGAIKLYRDFKASPVNRYADLESRINSLGYRSLEQKRYAEAIAIFKLNTEDHPQSANAWDSLGEAYMQSGDMAMAINAYQRSLALDPSNSNAREMITRLGIKK